MAESDSDGAFESADEGENIKKSDVLPLNEEDEDETLPTAVPDQLQTINKVALDRPSESAQPRVSSWSWGGWSSSLINSATSSVGLFTEQLKQGLNAVIDTMEGGLGVPSPEELAAENKGNIIPDSTCTESTSNDNEAVAGDEKDEGEGVLSLERLMSGVSSLTGVLEQTGAKVIKEGLDTLELFGRKTMDVLQDGDPGLRKTRTFLERPKTDLSKVLKEAKDGAVSADSSSYSDREQVSEPRAEPGEFEGLVYMEAIELLSKQCEGQLAAVMHTLSETERCTITEELDSVKKLFEDMNDDPEIDFVQNFEEQLSTTTNKLKDLGLSKNLDRLAETWAESLNWLQQRSWKEEDANTAEILYSRALRDIQKFASYSIETMQKSCEMLLLSPEHGVNWAQEILNFAKFASTQVSVLATKYCTCLSSESVDSDRPDLIDPLITSVYLEASGCNAYIKNTIRLMIPIIQCTNPLVN